MPDTRNEQDTVWQIWHHVLELEKLIWELYDVQLIDRQLAEEDPQWCIESDANENDQPPLGL